MLTAKLNKRRDSALCGRCERPLAAIESGEGQRGMERSLYIPGSFQRGPDGTWAESARGARLRKAERTRPYILRRPLNGRWLANLTAPSLPAVIRCRGCDWQNVLDPATLWINSNHREELADAGDRRPNRLLPRH